MHGHVGAAIEIVASCVAGIMALPYLPLGHAVGDLVFVIGFVPPMMWAVAMCRPPARLMPAMDWLGNFSLPLYCVHLTILVSVSEIFGREPGAIALAVAASLGAAYAFSRLISFRAKPTQARRRPQAA